MIQPPFKDLSFGKDWSGIDSIQAPLGLIYIGSILLEEGYPVEFIDFNVDKLEEEVFIRKLKQSKYLLITCQSELMINVKRIINLARKINPEIYIICGGPYCNLTGKYVEDSDLTVIGEVEEVLKEIMYKIFNNESLGQIPGLIYKERNSIIKNEGYLLANNMDAPRNVDHILTVGKDYGRFLGYKFGNIAGIMTSRGCPYNCKFCTHKGTFNLRTIRKRSIKNVVDELEYRYKNGTKYVIFYDDNILVDKSRVIELMNEITKRKIHLKMIIQGRVDSADYDFYKRMYDAGVMVIMFGIENPNQDVLDFYNKGINISQIEKAINVADKVGIVNAGFFMLGSPLETKEHFERTKKFIKDFPISVINVSILGYYEGSELWKEAVEQGKISSTETVAFADKRTSNFSFEEWKLMREELLKEMYLSPKKIINALYKSSKQGLLLELLKLIWYSRKEFLERIKAPYFMENLKNKIEV